MRQVKDSPMKRTIKQSMTVLKFARAKQAGNQRVSGRPEGLHANKTAPRKHMTYPIYFQMRKYVTNLYLHGTEVTRSFAAFGGSCAPATCYNKSSLEKVCPSAKVANRSSAVHGNSGTCRPPAEG